MSFSDKFSISNISILVLFVAVAVAVAVNTAYLVLGNKVFSSANLEYQIRNGVSFTDVDLPL